MKIKDAIYRELRFSPVLSGLVSGANVKLDFRKTPAIKQDSEYPFVIFRRVTESENNQVKYARDRFEIELIGLKGSSTKGDDLLETMKDTLKDYFMDQTRMVGAYDDSGNAAPGTGLRIKGNYVNTIEGYSAEMDEKAHIMIWVFYYLR